MFDLESICTKKLTQHEGKKTKVYLDTKKKLTWGIGRNLTAKGLSNDEIMVIFKDNYLKKVNSYINSIYRPYLINEQYMIGLDCNLSEKSLSDDEINFLFKNDYNECIYQLSKLDWYNKLDTLRKYVMVDMCFNLGIKKLTDQNIGFNRMISYLKQENYIKAGEEMLNSLWADQVKLRAIDLYNTMTKGTLNV